MIVIHGTKRIGALVIVAGVVLAACTGGTLSASPSTPPGAGSPASGGGGAAVANQLNGAGSTFIFPLLSKMGEAYNEQTGVRLNYQSIGSGGGIKAWTENTVDFGASDAFLQDSEIQAAAGKGEPVEIPATFGAVVVAYNLPGLTAPIRMTPDAIAGLFDGRITKWNDPVLSAANPGVTLPATDVSVVHRSDGSGTTSIFTTYLTSVSDEWVQKVGAGDGTKSAGKTVEWPTGLGASGNEGVTQGINQTEGGVGYIELAYALQNKIPFADVQNKSGAYVTPSLASVTAAANLPSYPSDLRFNLVNTEAADGYPITGTTWLIVYRDLSKVLGSKERASALVSFLWWAIHDGQSLAAPLYYGSLPDGLLKQDEAAVRSINWSGEGLLPTQ
ncbi:MAG TPA: phosphate ABC transporter substrate-binding protein PstS [Candidatus Limnocylindrales bacterium]|nr:phosphate ABC transporter substrate-binding protein PstS [Candidatus Limnocylindrales bacterium]